ncbi:resistance protein [Musa troglodytarum]|uniref:Resistance protein n=1 Tax=Musa troglodytarum TaxID=320322 RepID=A0A9E7GF66_9LILI|nr:resistance protein [Musa troglodytarum]
MSAASDLAIPAAWSREAFAKGWKQIWSTTPTRGKNITKTLTSPERKLDGPCFTGATTSSLRLSTTTVLVAAFCGAAAGESHGPKSHSINVARCESSPVRLVRWKTGRLNLVAEYEILLGCRIESIPPLIRHGTYLLVSNVPMERPNKADVKEELKCLASLHTLQIHHNPVALSADNLNPGFPQLRAFKNRIHQCTIQMGQKGAQGMVYSEEQRKVSRVHKLEEQYNEIENLIGEDIRCFGRRLPNLSSRHKIGKEATRKEADAKKLLDKRNFQNIFHPWHSASIVPMPMGDFMAFGSTRDAMDKVMNASADDNVHLIGIYGMGGVGKTTLMEELCRRLHEEKKFDAVVEVLVSQNPTIAHIQRDIADRLGLRDLGPGETAISLLASRMKKENKIFIMLDDIWARLDLREVGIPYGEEHTVCKIILTSRKFDLCHVMETDVSVEVAVLSEADSWELFKSKAGDVA